MYPREILSFEVFFFSTLVTLFNKLHKNIHSWLALNVIARYYNVSKHHIFETYKKKKGIIFQGVFIHFAIFKQCSFH